MKILYLIPRFTTGGAERLVLQYAKYFKDQGNEALVASVVGGGELIEEFKQAGIETYVSNKKNVLNLIKNYRNLKKIIKKFKPDIIHTHVFSADVAGYLLRKNTVWISTAHNVEKYSSSFRKFIWKFILKKANRVIAVSQAVYDFYRTQFKVGEKKLVLIKNGIELDQWLKISDKDLFAPKNLRLAIIGRLEKQKGHEYLFKALAEVKFSWTLDIFGAGSLQDYLKNLARELNILDKINFGGVSKNLEKQLAQIDVVVQPSLWEGLSLTVMEAMAAGRLVITTLAGGAELIEDEQSGLIVPSANVEFLVEALKSVDQNRVEAKKIASKGREWAMENFGIEENFREIERLLIHLISNSPNSPNKILNV